MMGAVLAALFFVLSPAGVLWLCRRVKPLGAVGPVLILYVLGFAFGNVFDVSGLKGLQDALSSAMIPVAIPLLLFGCGWANYSLIFGNKYKAGGGVPSRKLWLPKREGTHEVGRISGRAHPLLPQITAMSTGLIAVITAVIIGFILFGDHIEDAEKIGAMFSGCYTGGTVNLAAIKAMLGVKDETFILVNSCDMLVSFIYLAFLMLVGIRILRRILDGRQAPASEEDVYVDKKNPYAGLMCREGMRQLALVLGLDAVIVAAAAGLGMLSGQAWFMTVFILALTTFGIAASFWGPVRRAECSYDVGMYFIYVFSVTVASMADLSEFNLEGSLYLLAYMSFVIFGSLLLQVLFARVLRLDADLVTVTSVTYVCSPPFVPMIAGAMKNRKVLAPGLTIGVIGYAVGNYLGYAIFRFLVLF